MNYFFCGCSVDLLCSDIILFAISVIVLRHNYEFAMCFVNKRWIHYLFGDFTYWFREFTMRTLFFANTIFLPTSSGLIGYFANSSWIYYLFREYTMNALFVPRIHYNFTTFFGIKLCLHYLFREYIKKSWFVWRSHHKSIICLTFLILSIYLQIHYELI